MNIYISNQGVASCVRCHGAVGKYACDSYVFNRFATIHSVGHFYIKPLARNNAPHYIRSVIHPLFTAQQIENNSLCIYYTVSSYLLAYNYGNTEIKL